MYKEPVNTIIYWGFKLFIVSILLAGWPPISSGQQSLRDVNFSGQFFLSYEHDVYQNENTSEFAVKRGYITFRNNLNNQLEVRFTQDVTIDRQGDGSGDIELRLKYAFVNYTMKDVGIFTSPNIEAGVVHRPWIDFEQDVNDYRAQKSMFLDQNNILFSADYGIQFATGIGPELDTKKKDALKSNPARYGSFAIGLYNGGGYSDVETNNNKMVEARLSLRPLPDLLSGFQASFLGAFGKGNIPEASDFHVAGTALTYESLRANIVLQGFRGTGDSSGHFVDPDAFEAYHLKGWSAFTDIQPFEIPLHITLRYDELYNRDLDRLSVQQWVAGVGYVFSNRSKIMLDVSRRDENTISENTAFTRFELVTEIRF